MMRDVALILIVVSIMMLFLASHNIDMAHNMEKHDLPLDINLIGQIRTTLEIYLDGQRMLAISIFYQFIAIVLLILKERFSKPFQRKGWFKV